MCRDICAFNDASASPPELMPNVILRTDMGLSGGVYTLSLEGAAGAIKIWATGSPGPGDSPLLACGQTVTDGANGADFAGYPGRDLYVEAVSNGTARLTYRYVGTGDAAGISCEASLKMTAAQIEIVDCMLYVNPSTSNQTKYVVATILTRENTNTWTAKFKGPAEKNTVRIKYRRSGIEAEVQWDGDTEDVFFEDGKLNMDVALFDGSSQYPEASIMSGILAITGAQHGDRIVIEDSLLGCRAELAVVKNFTWNDLQRLGINNLSLDSKYNDLDESLKNNIVNTIVFCLDQSMPREQHTQMIADTIEGLTVSPSYTNFHSVFTNPPLAVFDVPSAVGVGFLPYDHMHFHMMLEQEALPLELADMADSLSTECQEYNNSSYEEMETGLRADLVNLLNCAVTSNIPLTISHTYDATYTTTYVDPVSGVSNLHIADPIRNIKCYLPNGSPTLFLNGPDCTGVYERNPPVQVWQTQLFVNRHGKVEIFASKNSKWILDAKSQIHDGCQED